MYMVWALIPVLQTALTQIVQEKETLLKVSPCQKWTKLDRRMMGGVSSGVSVHEAQTYSDELPMEQGSVASLSVILSPCLRSLDPFFSMQDCMLLMGLKETVYWLSWTLTYAAMTLLTSLVLVSSLRVTAAYLVCPTLCHSSCGEFPAAAGTPQGSHVPNAVPPLSSCPCCQWRWFWE